MLPAPPPPRTPWFEALVAALGCAVGLLVCAWPAILSPRTQAIGGAQGDFASVVWSLWRAAQAGPASVHPDVLFPAGATLWLAALPQGLLLAPLTWLAGPVASFNLLQVLHPALAFGATWLLLRGGGSSRVAASTGSTIFALAPAILSATHNGNVDTNPHFILPMALFILQTRMQTRLGPAVAGAALGFAAWLNPYTGVMAAFVGVLAWAAHPKAHARWAQAALVAALVGGAAALAQHVALADAGAMVRKAVANPHGSASLLSFVWPDAAGAGADGWTTHGSYLGLSAILLAIAAPAGRRRLGVALLITGVLLALGPRLRFGVEIPQLGAHSVALPWLAIRRLPGLNNLHLVYRFAALAGLGLALLAASAVDRLPRKLRLGAPAVLVLDVMFFGGGSASVAARPVPPSPACSAVSTGPGGPQLDVPGTRDELALLAQTCHGRPVAAGINRPYPGPVRAALRRPRHTLTELRDLGFQSVVVHDHVSFDPQAPPANAARERALADALIPLAQAEGLTITALPGATRIDLAPPGALP